MMERHKCSTDCSRIFFKGGHLTPSLKYFVPELGLSDELSHQLLLNSQLSLAPTTLVENLDLSLLNMFSRKKFLNAIHLWYHSMTTPLLLAFCRNV